MTKKYFLRWFAALFFVLAPACSPVLQKKRAEPVVPAPVQPLISEAPDSRPRLEKLVDAMEAKREEHHIPGLAIAVVKDDTVILARGFGYADLEREIPVSQETMFCVGSTTKAFTSALIGMLTDQGKMDWDDPVTRYLPYLKMKVEDEGEGVTIRDMLCHRTGFARMGLLWAGGTTTSEEILMDSVKAEPYAGFREKFYYNNVMYLGAGEASARVAGTDWGTLLETRILDPLGMKMTTTDYKKIETEPLLSKGYLWEEDKETYKRLPMRNLENIAPAGAIISNVMDMSRWVRFQLGKGAFEGNRLISEEALNETWSPQIQLGEGFEYGLGWFVREWNGKKLIEHGGNIDGYAAMVAFLPEEGVGFVMLSNVTATPLQQISVNLVFEHILGEEEETKIAVTGGKDPFADYLGEYIANFGSFRDAIMTVQVKDGKLAVDVPGQTVYELKDPNEDGKRMFALTDMIAVSFERNESDEVVMMRLHQGGFDFEVPKKGVTFKPEIDPDKLQKYLGKYAPEDKKIAVTLLIQNNRLAIDVPKQMVFELKPPDEDGHWRFRIRKELSVVFNSDENGSIVSMTQFRGESEEKTLFRSESEVNQVPSLDEILALRGSDKASKAIEAMGLCRMKGTIKFPQAGVEGSVVAWISGDDRFRTNTDLGKYGHIESVVGPEGAATDYSFSPFEEHRGKYLEQARLNHPTMIYGDLRTFFDDLEVLKADDLDGREVFVLSAKHGELPSATLYLDAETGDIVKQEQSVLNQTLGSSRVVILYEDFRELNGVRIPFRTISRNEQIGRSIVQYDDLETGLNERDGLFILKNPNQ